MEVVLIDDDKLIRLSWSLKAQASNISLHTFPSVSEFLTNQERISKEAIVYIDSNLGESCSGEVASKQIYDLGYNNLWLATGYDEVDLTNFPWLKGKISKAPPF